MRACGAARTEQNKFEGLVMGCITLCRYAARCRVGFLKKLPILKEAANMTAAATAPAITTRRVASACVQPC